MRTTTGEKRKYYPLTHAQKRIYYDTILHPDAPWANVSFLVKYKKELDFKLLEQSINKAVQENEGLRLRIVEFDFEPEPLQYAAPYKEHTFDYIDFSGADPERRLREWVDRMSQTPFEFQDNDLFYFACITFNENESGYYLNIHHTIADGWSCYLLFTEINEIYENLQSGKRVDHITKPSYIQYIKDEKEYLESPQAQADKKFWHGNLLPLPKAVSLSSGVGNPDNIKANDLVLTIPGNLRAMMHKYCLNQETSLYKLLLSAFSIYIFRVTGIEDMAFAGVNHNRSTDNHKKMIGMFVSTFPIRIKIDENMTFNRLLKKNEKEINYIVKNHQKYPFDILSTELREISDSNTGYLLDLSVIGHTDVKRKTFSIEYVFPGYLPGALLIHLNISNKDKDGILELLWCYQVERFSRPDIMRIHYRLINVLNDVLSNPDKKILEIELLSPEDKNRILYSFNKTQAGYPKERTIHQVFAAQVEKTPDNIVLVFQEKQLTYRGFNEKANQLARVLREKGVKPDHFVGLMVDRSLEMVVGMLAVLKSGGAYLPIDPDYPDKRILYMLKDSEAGLLLTQQKYPGRINLEIELIDPEDQSLYRGDTQNLPLVNTPGNLAYAIYTSGSTGMPKGVMIEHYSVINLAFSQMNTFKIDEKEKIFQFSSMCFDASVEQIYIALFSGAALVLIDKTVLLDMDKFEEFIDKHSLTHIHGVPAFVGAIPVKKYKNLKRMISGGDVCPSLLVKKWLKYCDFCNEYGPTETTVTSIQLLLKKSENLQYRFSIGNALNNTFIYILDKHMRVVPIGVPGELCIGGDGVARGYLNRPELTAEKFARAVISHSSLVISSSKSTNDHCPMTNDRLYRTGDLARWLPDGNIDFLGRIDFQVKIRGFRIETGEIESKILAQEEQKINDTVVIPREDIAGEKYLCAYIVSDKKIDISMLERSLSENLPDYMVPPCFVQIENIPLTPTGKVDRKALPAPEIKEKGADYAAPRNEIEEKLVEMWSDLLHLKKEVIGIDDNFFKLGGHSLKAAVMITVIHKELNVKVSMRQVFEMATIRRLGEYIKGAREEEFSSIEPVEEKEYYPQASAQKRLYFIEQLEKDSILYNLQLMDVYCKGVEKEALEEAFRKLLKRHESLRTSFFTIDGEAVQKVHTCEEVIQDFEIEYWETAEDGMIYSEDPGKEWTKVTGLPFQDVIEHFVRPFDLAHPPLLRAGFIKIWGNTKILMLDMHHIVSDGVSNVTLIKDLWRLYDEEELPGLRIQYKDFAQWGNSEKQKAIIKKQELFWLKEFQGEVPVLNLPYDYPRPAKMSFAGDMLHFEISIEETRKLNVIARELGQTLYMVLFAVYVVLLSKLSGQDDIAVGTVTAGRSHADLQPIIGIFVETLVLHSYPAGNKIFREFLKEVKQRILAVFENQYYPFEELVSKVATRQDASRNPLFDVLFVLDNEAAWFEEYLHEVLMLNKSNPYKIQRSKFDITLIGAETADGLQFNIEYNTRLFKEETINRFIEYFKKIVSSICKDCDQKISDIEIIPDLERGLLLFSFNDTESLYPRDKTIHELFEEQAAKNPDNTAVKGMAYGPWGIELTYRELNEKVNPLARLLRKKGLQADDIAAVMVEPSQEMIIGLLAILKAGGAFMPIDHKIPADRIKYILEESGTRYLLTGEELPEEILFGGEIIKLNNTDIYKGDGGNLKPVNTPGDIAYVIYTSGSTGKPKGVMVEHRSLANLCFWHNIYYSVTARDQASKYAGFGFDASVWEVFPYLVIGAALHIVPEEIKLDIKALNRYFNDNGITIGFLPTQLCEQFMTIDNMSLRVLLTGGDKLKTFTKKNYRLFNNYGPTENTVVATSFPVSRFKSNIPIGKPVYNNQIYILDNSDNLQPIGVPGELCIGGDSLARGYLNNPELTREKFTVNPYAPPAALQLNADKLYRTGDLVRWLADGNIEFLGRIDYQVKIRGFRIELGEIENQLLRIEEIKAAVVIAGEDRSGQKYLSAYIVPQKTGVNVELVKERLAKNLPEYMIPAHFVQMDRIPLNPSGKIDKKALPTPEVKGIEYTAPTTDTEKLLAEIWSGVLGIEKIGIDDNFFTIGGDSIKTIMVNARLQKHGIVVNINDFFSNPTIKRLAKHVKKMERKIDQGIVTGDVELTPIQTWFFEKDFNEKHYFNHVIMLQSRERFNEEIIRKVFEKIVMHHDALRMIYEIDDKTNDVVQTNRGLKEGKLYDLEIIDPGDKDDVEKELEREAARIQRSIDLKTGPLVKLGLFKTIKGDSLMIVIHHTVVDSISWRILMEDFEIGYQQAEKEEEIKFQDKTDSFKDWAFKLKKYADSRKALDQLEYWQRIENIEIENLPRDHEVGKEDKTYKNHEVVQIMVAEEETEKLIWEVNWVYNTEINDILLTALGMAVNEWSRNEKVLINLEGHGREAIIEDIDITRTVGWFTSQYPVLLDMKSPGGTGPEEEVLANRIRHVKETLRRVPNKGIDYGILRYLTSPEKKGQVTFKRQPEISFNYHGRLQEDTQDDLRKKFQWTLSDSISPGFETDYAVDIIGIAGPEGLRLSFGFNKYEYDRTSIEKFAHCFKSNLLKIINHCVEKRKEILSLEMNALDYHIKKEQEIYLQQVKQQKWPDLTAKNDYRHILLTGSTGFMGAHLVYELLENRGAVLYLPVRGTTQEAAEERFKGKMAFYFGSDFFNARKNRIVILRGDLRQEKLGMDDAQYEKLGETVEAIVHPAANVKHHGLYEELYKDNVIGTEHLLKLAVTGKKKDFHYISTLDVGYGNIPGKEYVLFTEFSHDVGQEIENIYLKSKFEAEKRVLDYREKGLNGSIYRVGNLIFHSHTGKFQENIEDDYFYAIIRGVAKLGMVSDKMKKIIFDMSFIDYIARATVLLITRKALVNETYHLCNPNKLPMKKMAEFLSEVGYRLTDLKEENVEYHFAKFSGNSEYEKIIELLKLHSWIFEEREGTETVYGIDRTVELLKQLNFKWPTVNEQHIEKMISYCKKVGFL